MLETNKQNWLSYMWKYYTDLSSTYLPNSNQTSEFYFEFLPGRVVNSSRPPHNCRTVDWQIPI